MDSSGWDERYRTAERLWSAEPNIFVADRLGGVDPGRGLDLASGEGRNAVWLAERGWEMTAVDFSEVAVERGRRYSGPVDFVVKDVLTWEPNSSVRFDLVLIAYLHLVEDDFAPLIRRAVTWLKPAGQMFMVGHDRSNIAHGVGGPQDPGVLWDPDEITAMLDGLEIIEAGVVERAVESPEGMAVARDTLVRARAPSGSS